jgi:hypothetical protein
MLDIEAGFLEAELDEDDVYIAWPDVVVLFGFVKLVETQGTCLKLMKACHNIMEPCRPRSRFGKGNTQEAFFSCLEGKKKGEEGEKRRGFLRYDSIE